MGAVVVGVLVAAAVAVSANIPRATGESSPLFYLDIGASASFRVQPNGVVGHNGEFTKYGYGDDLVRLESARGVTLDLDKVGCMGETAPSMLTGDKCHTLPHYLALAGARVPQGPPERPRRGDDRYRLQ